MFFVRSADDFTLLWRNFSLYDCRLAATKKRHHGCLDQTDLQFHFAVHSCYCNAGAEIYCCLRLIVSLIEQPPSNEKILPVVQLYLKSTEKLS